jgi:hypothetical protein
MKSSEDCIVWSGGNAILATEAHGNTRKDKSTPTLATEAHEMTRKYLSTSPLPPGEGQGEGITQDFYVIDFFRVFPCASVAKKFLI